MKKMFYKSYGRYSQQELQESCLESEEAIMDCINQDWEDFMDIIKYIKFSLLKCVINGELGLWDGKHTIKPVYGNLINCTLKCLDNSDDVEIYEEDGNLKIDSYHHDGVNHFTISLEDGSPINLYKMAFGI